MSNERGHKPNKMYVRVNDYSKAASMALCNTLCKTDQNCKSSSSICVNRFSCWSAGVELNWYSLDSRSPGVCSLWGAQRSGRPGRGLCVQLLMASDGRSALPFPLNWGTLLQTLCYYSPGYVEIAPYLDDSAT